MSATPLSFYLDRAADSRRAAKAATLDNVRERFLLSERTWRDLAARAKRVAGVQAKLASKVAAARAAAAA
ncbi:MAG: hypothetical protein QOI38_2790 [Sphingomonadales bacterium]|jgi:hypothetical protein|nr:hypothetical protein [Sphingomonadales bacterium]